jgi:flagellar hook protein FlgE
MDPISTARYGMMAASKAFEASATRVAGLGANNAETDLASETVNQVEAKQAFSANVAVIKIADSMWDSLLQLQSHDGSR